jgi:hypothetical protein
MDGKYLHASLACVPCVRVAREFLLEGPANNASATHPVEFGAL